MSTSLNTRENPIPFILDIPPGWGNTKEEFKEKVIALIKGIRITSVPSAPCYDITNVNGSITPFYPILFAVSPEGGIITKEEIEKALYPKFVKEAVMVYVEATQYYADHINEKEVFLAWGLEQGIFSATEIRKIRFDHGDTPESYIRDYGNPRLLKDFMEKIIHPYSPMKIQQSVRAAVDDCCFCLESH